MTTVIHAVKMYERVWDLGAAKGNVSALLRHIIYQQEAVLQRIC